MRQLQSVLQRDPEHPGACHYYIHAVEAVNPRLAIPCAELLAHLMPGAGHMVHMPAHIYIRVGRYADAAESNVHAIHDDETFIEGQHPTTVYSLAYYPHIIHFLAFASTMAGRSKQALDAAREQAPVEALPALDGEDAVRASSEWAARLLAISTRDAEKMVAEAREQADRLVANARTEAARTIQQNLAKLHVREEARA